MNCPRLLAAKKGIREAFAHTHYYSLLAVSLSGPMPRSSCWLGGWQAITMMFHKKIEQQKVINGFALDTGRRLLPSPLLALSAGNRVGVLHCAGTMVVQQAWSWPELAPLN